ncbi:MAG: peptidoglycan-binding protein [Clostridia bacterium]|nr:peptidoglycan-binding protein [Clostridia bacterium]
MSLITNDISVDRAAYIRELQSYLRTVQRYRTGSTLVPADGIFGSRTTAAVREFQQEEGLPVTGIVDRATWDALYLAYLAVLTILSPPKPIQVYQTPETALVPGDQGDGVAFLQVMLRRLAQRFPGIRAETVITGVYSPVTAQAIAAVQRLSGLPETGNTDRATWEAVTRLYGTG